MIQWALDHIHVMNRSICTTKGVIIGSFLLDYLQVMYKIHKAQITYDVDFIHKFYEKRYMQFNIKLLELIRPWKGKEHTFKEEISKEYYIDSLEPELAYVTTMLCCLFGRKNETHFHIDWVSLIQKTLEGYSFNLTQILSDNICKHATSCCASKTEHFFPPFYMFTYIMDNNFYSTPFTQMGWILTKEELKPIHLYHSKIWEENGGDHFYQIFYYIIIPIYENFFYFETPNMFEESKKGITKIGD